MLSRVLSDGNPVLWAIELRPLRHLRRRRQLRRDFPPPPLPSLSSSSAGPRYEKKHDGHAHACTRRHTRPLSPSTRTPLVPMQQGANPPPTRLSLAPIPRARRQAESRRSFGSRKHILPFPLSAPTLHSFPLGPPPRPGNPQQSPQGGTPTGDRACLRPVTLTPAERTPPAAGIKVVCRVHVS